ncbi:hypothetical protein [Aciditerrimonas ferrireducens]|nr:hypothetical protein [Aciditerrimonas ferrireducens]MCK4176639.1 hypothetical protein [Aciditerrimonas ferrireducens]
MATRMEIELTSRRDDGTWTWRAAGARQPKGVVEPDLVPADAAVGTRFRAEVEPGLDGVAIVHLAPLLRGEDRHDGAQRLEILGSGRVQAGVSVRLARRRAGDRRPGEDRDRRRPREDRPRDERPRHDRPREDRRTRGATPAGEAAEPRAGEEARARRGTRSEGGGAGRAGRPGARRFTPSTTYRNAVLASLRPEQLPVAEQLLRGGIPQVRRAIEEQNARAKAEGRDGVAPEPLLAMAEELLPTINLAAWKDRAVAARDAGRTAPLRELRAIVAAASTVGLDDEGRELLTAVRQALEAKVAQIREAWLGRLRSHLAAGRVVEALQESAQPPDHGTRLPADLAMALAQAASEAMRQDLDPTEWLALLDAVVASPVRRSVRPAGLPETADEELRRRARQAAGLVPELARLLGIPLPPPPGARPVPARAS